MVTLYSGPGCRGCLLTEKVLKDEKMEYRKVDLSTDPEAREYVTSSLGFNGVPVVETSPGVAFQGFRPERLRALARKELIA